MTVLLDLSVREISGCAWVTGTKEADTDTEHSTSHPEVSSFPLREAMCQTKKASSVWSSKVTHHKESPSSTSWIGPEPTSDSPALPPSPAAAFAPPPFLLGLPQCFWWFPVGVGENKIKNGLAKTQQRKINHHQTTASVFTASFIGLWHTF